ncbi:MAG TPA: hypothetical protein PKD10_05370 [Paracoccaceae bacterium]|nr:hypothetical protein [Paracoccaceae bacterium]
MKMIVGLAMAAALSLPTVVAAQQQTPMQIAVASGICGGAGGGSAALVGGRVEVICATRAGARLGGGLGGAGAMALVGGLLVVALGAGGGGSTPSTD